MRRDIRRQRIGVKAMPIRLFTRDRGWIGIGMEMEQIDQIAVSRMIRANGDGASGVFDRLIVPSLILKNHGQIAVGLGIVGIHFQGDLVMNDGLIQVTAVPQDVPQTVVGFGEIRLKLECLLT